MLTPENLGFRSAVDFCKKNWHLFSESDKRELNEAGIQEDQN